MQLRTNWPTLEETLGYLQTLGFTVTDGQPGFLLIEHPEEGSWFVFRARDPKTPAREIELLDMRAQLTGRGFVTDDEFAQFWSQNGWRTVQPAQPAS